MSASFIYTFSPVSDMSFDRLTDITPELLRRRGITLLIMDIDNTLSPYKINDPTPEVVEWVSSMRSGGVDLFFVSNNNGSRPEIFSEKLGIPYIKSACKPSRKGVIRAMELTGRTRRQTALVGDQSYTDVLCANRSGVTSILVEPISLKNPLLAIRYVLELPFRGAAREKFRKRDK